MIKVTDVQYVRIGVPELDRAEAFLADLGLVRSARTETSLYMRGTDAEHHCYVAELGDPGYIGMALDAASEEDLAKISNADGASDIEDIDEPGGGKRVRFTDPAGFAVDVVFGVEKLKPLAVKNIIAHNFGSDRGRLSERARFDHGPCQIKRLGHVVHLVENLEDCLDFYTSLFGFLISDKMVDDDAPETNISNYLRCDTGQTPADHHALYLKAHTETRCHHIGFEVEDLEAIMRANNYMNTTSYDHNWGVGRHVVGSNIFDQWFDPWGQLHEYFTDMDLLDADMPTEATPISESLVTHWGPPHPYG